MIFIVRNFVVANFRKISYNLSYIKDDSVHKYRAILIDKYSQAYAFALFQENILRDKINIALLKLEEEGEKEKIFKRYFN